MCGVIGFIGEAADPKFFFNALKRLEYRGYDSAGIAMVDKSGDVNVVRAEGKLSALEPKLARLPPLTHLGIGHTRWATHGKPSEKNAHPHRSGNIVLLHNGIIENYREIKEFLIGKSYVFESETDTEVAAHLLNWEFRQGKETGPEQRMRAALVRAVKNLKGAFAFAIICTETPDVLYAVKDGSPMVLGADAKNCYLASGISALVEHTQNMLFLEDGEMAFLRAGKYEIIGKDGQNIQRSLKKIEWSVSMMEKAGFRHYMLKEIHEQPQAMAQTLSGKILIDSKTIDTVALGLENIDLSSVDRLHLIACGTSYYAALVSRYFIESVTDLPVDVDFASEYRYRHLTANPLTLAVAVSQSGETADTLQAIKASREKGAQTLAIVNVPGSSIGHVCKAQSLLHAGPEIGVASTKAFTAQVTALFLLGLAVAQKRNKLTSEKFSKIIEDFLKIPSLIEKTLGLYKHIEAIANRIHAHPSILFIGRGPLAPVAYEGALKMKEISYIHAEAYPAGELKHGPIALIDENMLVVCLAPKDSYYQKTFSNIEEIKARGGKILAIGNQNDSHLMSLSDEFIAIPDAPEIAYPFLLATPLHLLAYAVAVRKGTDVDQPRNLAKSVTVE